MFHIFLLNEISKTVWLRNTENLFPHPNLLKVFFCTYTFFSSFTYLSVETFLLPCSCWVRCLENLSSKLQIDGIMNGYSNISPMFDLTHTQKKRTTAFIFFSNRQLRNLKINNPGKGRDNDNINTFIINGKVCILGQMLLPPNSNSLRVPTQPAFCASKSFLPETAGSADAISAIVLTMVLSCEMGCWLYILMLEMLK